MTALKKLMRYMAVYFLIGITTAVHLSGREFRGLLQDAGPFTQYPFPPLRDPGSLLLGSSTPFPGIRPPSRSIRLSPFQRQISGGQVLTQDLFGVRSPFLLREEPARRLLGRQLESFGPSGMSGRRLLLPSLSAGLRPAILQHRLTTPGSFSRRVPVSGLRGGEAVSDLRERLSRIYGGTATGAGTRTDPIRIRAQLPTRAVQSMARPQIRQAVTRPVQRTASSGLRRTSTQQRRVQLTRGQQRQPVRGQDQIIALFGFDSEQPAHTAGFGDIPKLSETIDHRAQVQRAPIRRTPIPQNKKQTTSRSIGSANNKDFGLGIQQIEQMVQRNEASASVGALNNEMSSNNANNDNNNNKDVVSSPNAIIDTQPIVPSTDISTVQDPIKSQTDAALSTLQIDSQTVPSETTQIVQDILPGSGADVQSLEVGISADAAAVEETLVTSADTPLPEAVSVVSDPALVPSESAVILETVIPSAEVLPIDAETVVVPSDTTVVEEAVAKSEVVAQEILPALTEPVIVPSETVLVDEAVLATDAVGSETVSLPAESVIVQGDTAVLEKGIPSDVVGAEVALAVPTSSKVSSETEIVKETVVKTDIVAPKEVLIAKDTVAHAKVDTVHAVVPDTKVIGKDAAISKHKP